MHPSKGMPMFHAGCNDIESIVKKFRSRAETNQQLKWMVEEVRAKADTIRRNNQMLKSQLEVRCP